MSSVQEAGLSGKSRRSSDSSQTQYDDIVHSPTPRNDLSREGEEVLIEADKGFTRDEDTRVTELARQLSNTTAHTEQPIDDANPFTSTAHPELDPNSESFNPRKWAKTLISLQASDPAGKAGLEALRAGVSFRQLSVHGFGKPTDFQKDVANVWLEAFASIKTVMGLGNKTKIQILRDFEGVVRSGEMLVVLGRPGSGCSTLLKTIAGETHGFFVDGEAKINYQGIPKEVMNKNFRGEVIYQAETDGEFDPGFCVSAKLTECQCIFRT
jgi:ATP-binding cassette subfamily G (WHITE) protein 2 (PDR)